MAGRPVDHRRRAELLDAITDYAVAQGFSELTWRPRRCRSRGHLQHTRASLRHEGADVSGGPATPAGAPRRGYQ